MIENNGVIEIKIGENVFKLKKFDTKLEMTDFASVLNELYQLSSSFESLTKEYEEIKNNKEEEPKKRVTAASTLADLARMFTVKSTPLFSKLIADMSPRLQSGTPLKDVSIANITNIAGKYVAAQGLTEEERKN